MEMALDKDYFDSIRIDVIKKKYYNANKVHAILEEIREQAEKLNAENAELRAKLNEQNGQRMEMGDAILTAQRISREIIQRANSRAAAIIADAEKRSAELSGRTEKHTEYAAQKVEECLNAVREAQEKSIEAINESLQNFLIGLYSEDQEEEPPDISEMQRTINTIARDINSLESEDP
jgi:cell division septum initiation protein DivIVA